MSGEKGANKVLNLVVVVSFTLRKKLNFNHTGTMELVESRLCNGGSETRRRPAANSLFLFVAAAPWKKIATTSNYGENLGRNINSEVVGKMAARTTEHRINFKKRF